MDSCVSMCNSCGNRTILRVGYTDELMFFQVPLTTSHEKNPTRLPLFYPLHSFKYSNKDFPCMSLYFHLKTTFPYQFHHVPSNSFPSVLLMVPIGSGWFRIPKPIQLLLHEAARDHPAIAHGEPAWGALESLNCRGTMDFPWISHG